MANRFWRAQRVELRGCRRVRVERGPQVVGHRRVLLAVGGIPATVGLRPLDLGEPARAHLALGDQARDVVLVDLRPRRLRAARLERDDEEVLVDRLRLPVDPAEAEGDLERLGVTDPGAVDLFLRNSSRTPGMLGTASSHRSQASVVSKRRIGLSAWAGMCPG